MRPKLAEVAERTGLSLATVSRVLNGKPGVAPSTRRLVLDVVGDLGYADTPPRQGTGVVGVVTPELDNPVFPEIAQAIEARLARRGLITMVCSSTSETVSEEDYLEHFREGEAAGVVVVNGRFSQVDFGFAPYEILRDSGMPVVLVNGMARRSPVPAVAADVEEAGRKAVRHLASLGHSRIGCVVGPLRYWTSQLFLTGWAEGMREVGLDPEDSLASESLFSIEGGRAGIVSPLESGATAVVTSGDLMALGAIAGARAWGRQVPEDVSVVGFDGSTLTAYTDPPLTTLRQPTARMAGAVVELLVDQMHGRRGGALHAFHTELVVRASTGPAPNG